MPGLEGLGRTSSALRKDENYPSIPSTTESHSFLARCQEDAMPLPQNLKCPAIEIAGSGDKRSNPESSSPHARLCWTSCTIWMVWWRRSSWPNYKQDLPISTSSAVFPVAAAAPHQAGLAPGPSFPFSLFGILFRGALITGQPAPHASKATCAGQCLCNHVTASATATTTGESVDSAASSSAPTKNKELLPAQRPVAGGDPGGQRDLDLGSRE